MKTTYNDWIEEDDRVPTFKITSPDLTESLSFNSLKEKLIRLNNHIKNTNDRHDTDMGSKFFYITKTLGWVKGTQIEIDGVKAGMTRVGFGNLLRKADQRAAITTTLVGWFQFPDNSDLNEIDLLIKKKISSYQMTFKETCQTEIYDIQYNKLFDIISELLDQNSIEYKSSVANVPSKK